MPHHRNRRAVRKNETVAGDVQEDRHKYSYQAARRSKRRREAQTPLRVEPGLQSATLAPAGKRFRATLVSGNRGPEECSRRSAARGSEIHMTKPGSIGPDIRAVMLCTWWSGPGARTGPLYRTISPLKISRRIQTMERSSCLSVEAGLEHHGNGLRRQCQLQSVSGERREGAEMRK